MLQIDDTVRSGYEKVIIVSPDTDSFVTAYTIIQNGYIYIYIYMWMMCGKDETKRVGQFHYIKFQPNWKQTLLIYCQRCMHLLDVMTSKIFSKNVALKKAETDVVENLVAFGKTPISAHIIASETFLVKCIHRKASCESFDELKMD